MAKIVIDCANPNDFAAVIESAENAAGNCTVTYAKQHLEMVQVGMSKSQRQSAKIISKDSGESQGAVRHKIRRGLKEVGHGGPKKSSQPKNTMTYEPKTLINENHGGSREGAGRPSKPESIEWDRLYSIFIEMHSQLKLKINEMAKMPEWKGHQNNIFNMIHNLAALTYERK